MPVLAVHYRRSDEPGSDKQGSWKEFTSEEAANSWLTYRTTKTKDSPKGSIIFQNMQQIETIMEWGKENQSVSLIKALENYLRWKKG